MTDEQTAAAILDQITFATTTAECVTIIVRALQAARKAPPGHIIDDAGVVRKVVAQSIGPVAWPADVPWVHILRVAATCDEMVKAAEAAKEGMK